MTLPAYQPTLKRRTATRRHKLIALNTVINLLSTDLDASIGPSCMLTFTEPDDRPAVVDAINKIIDGLTARRHRMLAQHRADCARLA